MAEAGLIKKLGKLQCVAMSGLGEGAGGTAVLQAAGAGCTPAAVLQFYAAPGPGTPATRAGTRVLHAAPCTAHCSTAALQHCSLT